MLSILLAATVSQAEVTINSMLYEMVDFGRLTRVADPYYTTSQASSYDRASVAPDQEGWFANADWGKYIRTEERQGRTEYVMADLAGPGSVVRIWSANPMGTIRFYFDGETEPRIENTTRNLLTGEQPSMAPPFGYGALRGTNLYFPIPYSKSLKITVDDTESEGLPRMYYHIGYRTFDPGTPVKTFRQDDIDQERISETRHLLRNPDQIQRPGGSRMYSFEYRAGKGASAEVELTGASAITELILSPFLPDLIPNMRWSHPLQDHNLLRNLWLEIDFDGETCVRAPVSDFFGSPPGFNAYESFAFSVRDDGSMICRFWMPFKKTATVRLVNKNPVDAIGTIQIRTSPYRWDERSLYFHAQWSTDRGSTRPMRDFNFMDVEGTGHYVGSTYHVANSVPGWWGEGDEKVWVDGESFPSTFGTGTEDYYGYAWSDPTPYSGVPYHTQPVTGTPRNFGHIANNRWHILDPIPFRESLKFDMEIWHWNEAQVSFSATAYWYANPGSTGPREIDINELNVEELLPPAPVEGAFEGEKMTVTTMTGGAREHQGGFFQLSGGLQLWWIDASPGDRLVLEFDVDEPGDYKVIGNFCHAPDYGIHRITVNGKSAGEIDFFGQGVSWKKIDLGTVTVEDKVVIEMVVVGANPKSAPKRHLMGLDYILLEKV